MLKPPYNTRKSPKVDLREATLRNMSGFHPMNCSELPGVAGEPSGGGRAGHGQRDCLHAPWAFF